MGRHRSPMSARRLYQLAEVQRRNRTLHCAFGKAGFIGQHAEAGFDRLPVLAGGAAGKVEINQEGRRLLLMPDDVAHEHVENVIIDWLSMRSSAGSNCVFQKRRHAWFCLPPMKTSDASGHS